jgi:hypothetical protein
MYDKAKVERINALVETIEDAEAKLNAELGGAPVKKTWSRRPKEKDNGEGTLKHGVVDGASRTG